MPWLMWSPTAVSYLAQLVMSCTITVYLLHRIVQDRRRGSVPPAMIWLSVTVGATTLYVLTCLLRAALIQSLQPYVLPWVAPFDAVALCALIQFAYAFPEPLRVHRLERYAVWAVSAAFFLTEMAVAVWRQDLTLRGVIEYRPALMDLPIIAGDAWAGVIFIRQFIAATQPVGPATGRPLSERPFLTRLLSAVSRRFRVGNARSAAARAYLIFTLLPLGRAILVQLRAYGLVSFALTDMFADWLTLAQLASFALIFLNHLPERSSFLVKLSGVSITLIFTAIVSVAWLIGPVYISTYQPDARVHAGEAYRFQPDGSGGYLASRVAYRPDSVLGQRADEAEGVVRLPFDYPFYGKSYDTIYIRDCGFAGFTWQPLWREAMFGYGRQPAVYVLAADLADGPAGRGSPEGGVFVNSGTERTVITWFNMVDRLKRNKSYTFQMTLYRNGTLDLTYIDVPKRFNFDLYAANRTATLIGITPGNVFGGDRLISMARDLPVHAGADTGLIDDYYLAFQGHVDRLYALIAASLPVSLLIVLIGLPAFLRVNLLGPLRNLMHGVETFRQGRWPGDVPVIYRDEIGYLTASFNDMARAQNDLVETLEERVTQRTAQIADMTARNARLEERVRLSGDLHDTVSQTLFSAAILADSLPEQMKQDSAKGEQALSRLGGLSRHALAEMRHLLGELRAADMEARPLGGALELMTGEFGTAHDIDVALEVGGDAPLAPDVRVMFLRIAQESLNNVAKHSGASRVVMHYDALAQQALLSVRDNGKGFDPAKVGPAHLGLQIMQERAQRLGAIVTIDAVQGQGTTVTLIWLPNDIE